MVDASYLLSVMRRKHPRAFTISVHVAAFAMYPTCNSSTWSSYTFFIYLYFLCVAHERILIGSGERLEWAVAGHLALFPSEISLIAIQHAPTHGRIMMAMYPIIECKDQMGYLKANVN